MNQGRPPRTEVRRRAGNAATLLVAATGAMAVILMFAPRAGAAGFTVTSTADTARDGTARVGVCETSLNSGVCTLRAAIQTANATVGADTITVPAGTYTLTIAGIGEDLAATGDLDITEALTITGAGMASTFINGGGIDRVFHARAGAAATFSDLTIENGHSSAGGGGFTQAGGIMGESSPVAITRVDVRNNRKTGLGGGNEVGGVYVRASNLTITDSFVRGNTSESVVGGVAVDTGAVTLTISGSTISNNTGVTAAGGVYFEGASATISNSTISGNNIGTGQGGGIYVGGGTMTITNTTISTNTAASGGGITQAGAGTVTLGSGVVITGNTATTAGGGIEVATGTLTGSNVTVSGNTGGGVAVTGGAPSFTNVTVSGNTGAGLSVTGGTATLTNVTLASNTGGGITRTAGTAQLRNTIVANNGATNCTGTVTSQGNNLEYPGATCGFTAAGDVRADPVLGSLASNGGATQTHALGAGSAAIDAGANAACPATDQRGTARPTDGNGDGTATCDIGAYEAATFVAPTSTPVPGAATATPAPQTEVAAEPAEPPPPTATPTVVPTQTPIGRNPGDAAFGGENSRDNFGPNDAVRLVRDGQTVAVVPVGRMSPTGEVSLAGILREETTGATYAIVRRETDGKIVRRWIGPNDQLRYRIQWASVTVVSTYDISLVSTIPLDETAPRPGQSVRRFDGTDNRIFAWDDAAKTWRVVPDVATFQALGMYWCGVASADETFAARATPGSPFPASGLAERGDYPSCGAARAG